MELPVETKASFWKEHLEKVWGFYIENKLNYLELMSLLL